MRILDKGSSVIVRVSRQEVVAFNTRWPCSEIPERSVYFEFDKRNGDLLDMEPFDMDGEAVRALSEDAQKFAGL